MPRDAHPPKSSPERAVRGREPLPAPSALIPISPPPTLGPGDGSCGTHKRQRVRHLRRSSTEALFRHSEAAFPSARQSRVIARCGKGRNSQVLAAGDRGEILLRPASVSGTVPRRIGSVASRARSTAAGRSHDTKRNDRSAAERLAQTRPGGSPSRHLLGPSGFHRAGCAIYVRLRSYRMRRSRCPQRSRTSRGRGRRRPDPGAPGPGPPGRGSRERRRHP